MQTYSVTLDSIITELHLEAVYLPREAGELHVVSAEINRPSLLLTGFTTYFDNRRIQVCGKVEMSYLETLSDEKRAEAIDLLFSYTPPAVVVSRGLKIYKEMLECGRKYQVPVLTSFDSTSNFMSAAITYLNTALAPRITRHGVFVEVYGEGILILGESGVGKSETAIELLKRGHRLIADDAVELRRISNKTINGASPDNIRHFIELRGVGIINVRRIFGMGAVKMSDKVDLVIQLVQWDAGQTYSNIDTEDQTINILDVEIPIITIPVKSGRNLAIIIEVAAMNNRQKSMGYNANRELLESLGLDEDGGVK
ncbi:MAG: HPr(Ser) kinase/phosphatase [Oscillospiraceae bacterium]|nr:HPr(Ser) kinase/phosphatase [Oscillospiraceae bacterium]